VDGLVPPEKGGITQWTGRNPAGRPVPSTTRPRAWIYTRVPHEPVTFGHITLKIRVPVRSLLVKQGRGTLVLKSVTIGESVAAECF
jgi:hypothetical protein